jgi:hypothetical protein
VVVGELMTSSPASSAAWAPHEGGGGSITTSSVTAHRANGAPPEHSRARSVKGQCHVRTAPLFLASEDGRFATGAGIIVDGASSF